MKINHFKLAFIITISCFIGNLHAGEWNFPVSASLVSGFGKITSLYEDNLNEEGYTTESVDGIPIGFAFRPYYEFENKIAVGVDIGPAMMIIGDTDFTNVPLNLNVRYSFGSDPAFSPYIRAGISHNFASGDYVEGSGSGFIGTIGAEFSKDRRVHFGAEIGCDTSEIEIANLSEDKVEKIKPYGFLLSVFVVF